MTCDALIKSQEIMDFIIYNNPWYYNYNPSDKIENACVIEVDENFSIGYGKLSGDDGSVHSGSASLSERAEHGEVRSAENASLVFLGVAFYNYDYKKLVADKIFRRTDEGI